ncbi:trans-aconitate methyltransferase [Bacillus pakistanensis]|uniref:Trans-aconitate methyltransferase n=1 Tax=Rossellomorea pakistanensis TaxID=992288 RepID=A0ABS2N6T6_9BACI|nr:replicative helicase loader/inhibitor [Bacillus pakistanensis]MBM7583542.1 trans-aconitate methyltransferase [Bacillus pakistanensis]
MIKRETYRLLELISDYYHQFKINQKKIDIWHVVLQTYSFEEIEANLIAYVARSPYPPMLSELTRKEENISRVIPDRTDTIAILYPTSKPANEEVVQTELAKMREILGIRRDSCS